MSSMEPQPSSELEEEGELQPLRLAKKFKRQKLTRGIVFTRSLTGLGNTNRSYYACIPAVIVHELGLQKGQEINIQLLKGQELCLQAAREPGREFIVITSGGRRPGQEKNHNRG